jgi:hypothetical protein
VTPKYCPKKDGYSERYPKSEMGRTQGLSSPTLPLLQIGKPRSRKGKRFVSSLEVGRLEF